jgi:L-2,4-diaminobutyrate decarboxylase
MASEPLYEPGEFLRVLDVLRRICADYLAAGALPAVNSGLSPEEIASLVDRPLPQAGRPLEDVGQELEEVVVRHANHLIHPRYVGHQVAPPIPAAAALEVLIAILNNGMGVWEMSPVNTIVERLVVRWFVELLGWPTPELSEVPGRFVSGGTVGNLIGLAGARAACLPDVDLHGLGAMARGRQPVIVAGSNAHFSIGRAANVLGIGRRNVVPVACPGGRMSPAAAREALRGLEAAGKAAIALVATGGTTALGLIDPLDELAAVARDEGVWLHVDAAHAGALLLNERERGRLAGIDRADSIAVDFHKLLFLPISTAMVLFRDASALARVFRDHAPYLFHDDTDESAWDLGRASLQTSRRGDALKVWFVLQLYGARGLAALQSRVLRLAVEAADLIESTPHFELFARPETNILCFRHVPPALAADRDALGAHNHRLYRRVNRSGFAFITATELEGDRYLRMTLMNPNTTVEHIKKILDYIIKP